ERAVANASACPKPMSEVPFWLVCTAELAEFMCDTDSLAVCFGYADRTMLEGRQRQPDFVQAGTIDFAKHNTLALRQTGCNFAPRVHQHGVAPGPSAILMPTALSGCQHITLVLDRSRAQEHFPMCRTRCVGEGRRNHNELYFTHGPIQFRKAQIVAVRYPDPAERQLHDLGLWFTRFDGHRFVVGFFALTKTEKVDFVVAADWHSVRRHYKA